jgi:hypothetical protein
LPARAYKRLNDGTTATHLLPVIYVPIQVNKRNREIAEENCRFCHQMVVST